MKHVLNYFVARIRVTHLVLINMAYDNYP